jgi:hypothetical protein
LDVRGIYYCCKKPGYQFPTIAIDWGALYEENSDFGILWIWKQW